MALLRFPSVLRLLAVLWMLACIAPVHPAAAQGNDVSELINLINGLRASKGLAPYSVDPGLMALAQQHSKYQAAIHTSTHLHSDGRTPPQIGVVENVAGGDLGYLTPRAAVYEIWADPVHGRTMTGYAAGSMGVGVANDGKTVYVLSIRHYGSDSCSSTDESRFLLCVAREDMRVESPGSASPRCWF